MKIQIAVSNTSTSSAKTISKKKFYIVDCSSAKDKIVEGPFTSKQANQIKSEKYPDSKKGAISHYVTSGQDCLDEGITWA